MTVVSERLRTFLQQRLSSLDQIEVVLLLRDDPSRSWTAPEVAAALRMPPEPAAMRLFLLASGGLLAFEPSGVPRYRFSGVDADTETLLEELSVAFRASRDSIADVVDTGPRDPLRSFADAFKLKR